MALTSWSSQGKGWLRPFLVTDARSGLNKRKGAPETELMKKQKVKPKGQGKETGANTSRGQVVKLRSAKAKTSWTAKLPSVTQWWRQAIQFVSEAWQELKKVTWPGRKETLGTTLVVIILVFFIASFLGLVDFGLSTLVKKVMR